MSHLNKAILLCVSFLLLGLVCRCGSSSAVAPPNGFLYAANSFRPGSVTALMVTTGALAHILNSTVVTTASPPYTLVAWPPPLASNATTVTTKFVYGGVPATSKGGVITRVLGRTLSGSVPGGIVMMPIVNPGSQTTTSHTLGTPQMLASGDYDPMAVTPGGNFLYAADLTTSQLAAFSIDSNKGTLTSIGPQGPPVGVAVGPDPFNVVVDPQSKFVFVANCDFTSPSNHGSVSVFAINSDGTLAAVAGSPFLIGGGASHPVALTISADSHFLFIASLDDKVYVESITNGALADLGAVSLPTGSTPVSIAISTDDNYIYTGNAGNHTLSFFLNCQQSTPPTGCPASGSPPPPLATPGLNSTTAFSGAVGVMVSDVTNPPSSTTMITSVSGFVYVSDYDHGTVQAFSITSTSACSGLTTPCQPGSLTASGSPVDTGGANPFGLALAH